MAEKTRYSDEELQEFKQIIIAKLDKAKKDYELLRNTITHGDGILLLIPLGINT